MKVMKRSALIFLAACLCTWFSTGCAQDEECSITGTTVNIGKTTGGTFGADLGNNHILYFNNINLNFTSGTFKDVGNTDCLEDITSWPGSTATSVAQVSGHGYIIKFADDTYARFISGNYNGYGSVSVTYEYPFTPQ